MELKFTKYQGTGNDFIMLDNLNGQYNGLTLSQIQFLCDRKMGVGADGLIKISAHNEHDFEVEYFNADGSQSFCGNGARCSVAFAKTLGLLSNETSFLAIDGVHAASINAEGIVRLEMLPVSIIDRDGDDFVVHTGSPHYVNITNEKDQPEIVAYGKSIRYSEKYSKEGINVNTVVAWNNHRIAVRTYERGVEDETLSCGTGVTACALVQMSLTDDTSEIEVLTQGGILSVDADKSGDGFNNIWLSGPAKKVYNGSVEL